ncbi:MAG: hypothetical protein KF836_08280 [Fimbriimonadaceae bacterium]|nr:hypothetical protein [Fimbriimonadaceae bacterium]
MQYFLYLRAIGLCARVALQSQDREDEYPCIVHHSGIVYDANKAAQSRHVEIGIPLKEAKVILQSGAAFVEYKPELFESARELLLRPCLLFSDSIQAGRAGEGLIDLSIPLRPLEIAATLLNEVYREVQLPLIAGIGPSSWLARKSASTCDPLALALGILPIEPVTDSAAWLAPHPVSILSPLDVKDRNKLRRLGFDRVSQVQGLSLESLELQFPKRGALIMQTALGKLSDPIKPNYPAKMIAEEISFGAVDDRIEIDRALLTISQTLAERLCNADEQAKTVVLTVVFESENRQSHFKNLTKPVISATPLYVALGQLFNLFETLEPIESLRVQLLDLSPSKRRQLPLALGGQDADAKNQISSTLNQITALHGTDAVRVASSLSLSFNQEVLREWKRVTGWR